MVTLSEQALVLGPVLSCPRPVDEGGYGIDCWVAERAITPDEARQVAAALLRAADALELLR